MSLRTHTDGQGSATRMMQKLRNRELLNPQGLLRPQHMAVTIVTP